MLFLVLILLLLPLRRVSFVVYESVSEIPRVTVVLIRQFDA